MKEDTGTEFQTILTTMCLTFKSTIGRERKNGGIRTISRNWPARERRHAPLAGPIIEMSRFRLNKTARTIKRDTGDNHDLFDLWGVLHDGRRHAGAGDADRVVDGPGVIGGTRQEGHALPHARFRDYGRVAPPFSLSGPFHNSKHFRLSI